MNLGLLEKSIEKIKCGDMSQFDYVYENTHKIVYFRILYIICDKPTAEDLLQEVYIRTIKSIHSYQLGSNFIAWMSKIGRNLALTALEKRKREIPTEFMEDYLGSYTQNNLFIFDSARKVLDETEYNIVMLCHVGGYKRREVSQILNLPISTVTYKNNEALKKLKKELEV